MVSFQFCMILQTLSWYRSFSHLCYPREVIYIYKYLWDWFVRERPNHHQGCYREFKFLHSQLFDNDDIHLLNMLSPFSKCFPLFLRLLHFFFSCMKNAFLILFLPPLLPPLLKKDLVEFLVLFLIKRNQPLLASLGTPFSEDMVGLTAGMLAKLNKTHEF